jgi:hypothetical protein
MLLDDYGNIKISDFSGSVILHGPEEYASALVSYDARSRKPGVCEATEQTDIFALGSMVYELATGHLPYAELQDFQVAHRFEMQKWPKNLWSITRLQRTIGKTIESCWEGHFKRADDVALKIKPDGILESTLPEIEPNNIYSSRQPSMYSGTTFCSDADTPNETYYPEPKPRSSARRKRSKRRRRTEKKTKKRTSFLGKLLKCLSIGNTSSANPRASYLPFSHR